MEGCCKMHSLGDNGIIIQFGDDISREVQRKIHSVTSYLDQHPIDWLIEYIPAFTTVAIFYDPLKVTTALNQLLLPFDNVRAELQQILTEIEFVETPQQRLVEIPVCYNREFGPDLAYVAEYNGLTAEEVIDLHTNGEYLVHMIGFSPGFPYISGLSKKITAPRRKTPRLKISARSVGIAGRQTGIYPIDTPGGWQIIGRTPLTLFQPNEEQPSLLKAGDRVKFKPISIEEFIAFEEKMR